MSTVCMFIGHQVWEVCTDSKMKCYDVCTKKSGSSTTGTPDWPIMQGQRSRSGLDAYPDPLRCAYLALPFTSWGAGHRLFTTLIATGFVEAPRKANQLTAVVLDRPMTLADLAMGKI